MEGLCYKCGFKGPSPYFNVLRRQYMCSVCWIRAGFAHDPETRLGTHGSDELSDQECAFDWDSEEERRNNEKIARTAAERYGCASDEALRMALEEILNDGHSLSDFANKADAEGTFNLFRSYASTHWTFGLFQRVLDVCRSQ